MYFKYLWIVFYNYAHFKRRKERETNDKWKRLDIQWQIRAKRRTREVQKGRKVRRRAYKKSSWQGREEGGKIGKHSWERVRTLKREERKRRSRKFRRAGRNSKGESQAKVWWNSLESRVWSWLRTNAGGVLNTCKSNEDAARKFSDGIAVDWVADGWVTREQPAYKRGITAGNGC